jgi:hypothetical protein
MGGRLAGGFDAGGGVLAIAFGTGGRRRAAVLARPVAAVSAFPDGVAIVLSFSFVFGFGLRRFRVVAVATGFIRHGTRFRYAWRVGMLRLRDTASRNQTSVFAVIDTRRVTDFPLSERRNASKCQQSQH